MKTKLNHISNVNPTFRNIFDALNSNKIVCVPNLDTYYKLVDGGIVTSHCDNPLNWVLYSNVDSVLRNANGTIYEEVEIEWHDNIPERGILCEVWDEDDPEVIALDSGRTIMAAIVIRYSPYLDFPFESTQHTRFKYARPLTLDQMKEFIYED